MIPPILPLSECQQQRFTGFFMLLMNCIYISLADKTCCDWSQGSSTSLRHNNDDLKRIKQHSKYQLMRCKRVLHLKLIGCHGAVVLYHKYGGLKLMRKILPIMKKHPTCSHSSFQDTVGKITIYFRLLIFLWNIYTGTHKRSWGQVELWSGQLILQFKSSSLVFTL